MGPGSCTLVALSVDRTGVVWGLRGLYQYVPGRAWPLTGQACDLGVRGGPEETWPGAAGIPPIDPVLACQVSRLDVPSHEGRTGPGPTPGRIGSRRLKTRREGWQALVDQGSGSRENESHGYGPADHQERRDLRRKPVRPR